MTEVPQPTGTVTVLFTDIVGSSALWDAFAEDMDAALIRHDELLEQAAAQHKGYIFKRLGDGFCIAFDNAADAVAAAISGQRVLAGEPWGRTGPIQVRMGLHSGTAEARDGDYFGPTVNRASRIQNLAHGGQILLSEATRQLVASEPLSEFGWLDLGRHELTGLSRPESIFQVVASGLQASFPPIISPKVCPNNLPIMPTPFIGRQDELARLEELLVRGDRGLITIIGPGGMGKTRLALELAHRLCRVRRRSGKPNMLAFPDGVYLVPLAAIESPAEIPPALYQALGFQPTAQDPAGRLPWRQFLDYLDNSELLLILDNFEQLTDGTGLVAEILLAAPKVRAVVTSREQLSLRGEQLFALSGMPYPSDCQVLESTDSASRYSGLALMMQSCERVDPGLEWTADDLDQAVRICHLLGGMPLAIELAAGWVEMLSLAEIASEIERNLDFLQTNVKDVETRHRSVRIVFDATWRRLEPKERELFRRLCIFRGGFTRAAAGDVAGSSLVQLVRLTKASLLAYDRQQDRYQIHRLLRQYGESKLSEDPAAEEEARDRHCLYYCEQLERWGQSLHGPRQLEIMARVDCELANIQLAWSWAVRRSHVHQIDQAVDALCTYYEWRFLPEENEAACRDAARMLVKLKTPDSKRVRARVLAWQGLFLPDDEDGHLLKQGLTSLKEAQDQGQNARAEEAFVLTRLGALNARGDHDASLSSLKTALELSQALGDARQESIALINLAYHALQWGKYQDVERYAGRRLDLCRELGDRRGLCQSLHTLGTTAIYTGDFEKAHDLLEQSFTLFQELGDVAQQAGTINHLGFLLLQMGHFGDARDAYGKQIVMLRDRGLFFGEPVAMASFSLSMEGAYEEAYAMAKEATLRTDLSPPDVAHLDWAKGAALLGLARQEEALRWLESSATTFEQLAQITVIAGVSALLLMADLSRARVRQAVNLAREADSFLAHILTVPAVALYYLEQGEVEKAVELYALASRHRFVTNSAFYEDLVGRTFSEATAALPEDESKAAKARGAQRELAPTIVKLAAEFGV